MISSKIGVNKMFASRLCLALSLVILPMALTPPSAHAVKSAVPDASAKADSDSKTVTPKVDAKKDKEKEKDKTPAATKDDKKKDKKAAKEEVKKEDEKVKDEKSKEDKSKKEPQTKADVDDAKGVKKGFFGFGNKADSKPAKNAKASKAAPVAPVAVEPKSEAKVADKKEEEKLPPFAPDKALISVLKDLSRSLNQSEEVKAITDANEKHIVELAHQILEKAVNDPAILGNRIVDKQDEGHVKQHLTAEAWSSGDVEINDKLHGSLAAVWAKRVGGLMTLTIAGDSKGKAPDGKPINQFIVVLTARSPVETGFDIQSQSEVTFWKGRLDKISVESECVVKADEEQSPDAATTSSSDAASSNDGGAKKKSIVLPPLLTERYRKHYELVMLTHVKRQRLGALAEADIYPATKPLRVATAVKTTAAKAPAVKKAVQPDDMVEQQDADLAQNEIDTESEVQAEVKPIKVARAPAGADTETEIETETVKEAKAESKPVVAVKKTVTKVKVDEQDSAAKADKRVEQEEVATEKVVTEKVAKKVIEKEPVEKAPPHSVTRDKVVETKKIAVLSPAAVAPMVVAAPPEKINETQKSAEGEDSNEPVLRKPKSNSVLVMPDRALAGQTITVALLDDKRNPEVNVEICFNGLSLQTDHNGQVAYQVPEDATAGRSLNIAMPSRSEDLPAVVDVLHPLNMGDSEVQPPRLDRTNPLMTLGKRTMVVDGHNFDGIAQNNRIIIDGAIEAQIIAASPVQLRFTVAPNMLRPGLHSLVVSTDGKRSNPVPFEFAAAEIPADAAKDASKVVVKVLGTTTKVNVKITNLTPDIVRINRESDSDILSSGGAENKATVPLQRIKKGAYKLQAEIEL